MKDHLSTRGVDFVSVDIVEDADALEELCARGLLTLPVVARGSEYVAGRDLRRVLQLAGLADDVPDPLAPALLVERIVQLLPVAVSYGRQLPAARYESTIPGRDRTYLGLVNHIVRHVEKFLAVATGVGAAFEGVDKSVLRGVERQVDQPDALADRAGRAMTGLRGWLTGVPADEPTRTVEVAGSDRTLHSLLADCAYSVAQHTRQLSVVLDMLGIRPEPGLTDEQFEGLPMPAGVWE